MRNRKLDVKVDSKLNLARQVAEYDGGKGEAQSSLLAQHDPLSQVVCRLGDESCAGAHASVLQRTPASRPIGGAQSLLQLQRQYGNRYVQRVLAQARGGDEGAEATPEVEQAIQRARGGGQALDGGVRGHMESAFGADFSGVRVHTDTGADTLNRALNARAFTVGQDIFFRQGAHNPGSPSGREILAHELTHVVQQTGDQVRRKLTVNTPGDRYEQEADRMAEQVLRLLDSGSQRTVVGAGQVKLLTRQTVSTEREKGLYRQAEGEEEEEEEEQRPSQTGMTPGIGGEGPRRIANAIVADWPTRLTSHISAISRSIIQRQRTVRWGSVGCPVPRAQAELDVTGAGLVVDGRFGRLTDAAVRNFQRAHPPLGIDGIIGPNTWPALHATAPGNHGLPIGEITNSNGWGTGARATNHRWQQLLNPTTTSFRRCQVTEADPGGGTDTCHFPGSIYAPFNAVTGGTWRVNARNRWGDDWVGWFTQAVTYYRNQGRAPCTASFPQSMRVVRPDGNVEYVRHQLEATIGTTTVSSTRASQTATRRWP